MSIITSRGETWKPEGAVGVTVTKSATPWANGSLVTVFTADADFVLVGINVDDYSGLSQEAEFDVVIGGVVFSTIPFSAPGANNAYHHWEYKFPVPQGTITSGSVVEIRARGSSSVANTFQVRLGVIDNFDGDYTTLTHTCYPNNTGGVSISPSATPWQWSTPWAELIPALPAGALIVGVAYRVPEVGSTVTDPTTFEMQMAEDA